VLTPNEEGELARLEYRTASSVIVTGLLDNYGRNRIRVDGEERTLSSGEFRLFFRLLSENDLGKGGWAHRRTLEDEEVLRPEDWRMISNLRGALGSHSELVETAERTGRLRVSTHRSLVRYDFQNLEKHEDSLVRDLLKKMARRKHRV
jgi:hypothetical protein